MQLIEAFQRLPLAFKIIWILAVTLILATAISTTYNSFSVNEEEASLTVERREVAGEGNAGRDDGDDNDIDDESYGEGPRRKEIDFQNDESREFEKNLDGTKDDYE